MGKENDMGFLYLLACTPAVWVGRGEGMLIIEMVLEQARKRTYVGA